MNPSKKAKGQASIEALISLLFFLSILSVFLYSAYRHIEKSESFAYAYAEKKKAEKAALVINLLSTNGRMTYFPFSLNNISGEGHKISCGSSSAFTIHESTMGESFTNTYGDRIVETPKKQPI